MRADRLISLILLLQTRGAQTGQQLAAELGVSERTVYRDIQALSLAGIPVYADHGPGGGFALVESYRTSLTGLTANEVQALFLLNVPALLKELGIGPEVKDAWRKLLAALPSQRQFDERLAGQRLHIDPAPWFAAGQSPKALQTVYQAILQDRCLHLVYLLHFDTRAEALVQPFGLVAKANRWYVVYSREKELRVLPLERILEAKLSSQPFTRPADFDLASFWESWTIDQEQGRLFFPVSLSIAPQIAQAIDRYIGSQAHTRIERVLQPDERGWIRLDVSFETLESARSLVLSLGGAVVVLAPEALRLSVVDFAAQTISCYDRV